MDAALIILQIAVAVTMLIGLVGLFFFLPGLTIIWIAGLVYGLLTGFTWVSGIIFGVMTVIMLGGNIIDNVIMGASARISGTSWLAIGIALVGGVVGTILLPPVGGLLLALLGIFAVEWIRLRSWRKGLESVRSWAVGCGGAAILRFGLGIAMIGLWVLWVFMESHQAGI
jgi:uncharacterized protein YqgC (DUF456 family)